MPLVGIFDREPVVILAALQALITVGVVFGLDWTAEQEAAVIAAAGALLALFARSQVTPVADPRLDV